jgi:hypothetical protein
LLHLEEVRLTVQHPYQLLICWMWQATLDFRINDLFDLVIHLYQHHQKTKYFLEEDTIQ